MKFKRNTHDKDGNPRTNLPKTLGYAWPRCDLNMLSSDEPRSVEEIYHAHLDYDKQFMGDGFLYTLPDIMEGLAHLIRLGVVVSVDDKNQLYKDMKWDAITDEVVEID